MAISKRMRDRIETLLSVYVGYLRGTSESAGWHGKGRMDEGFGGSGLCPSNAESIYQSRFVQREHALLGQAVLLLGRFDACRDCGKHRVDEVAGPCEPVRGSTSAQRQELKRALIYVVPGVCPACSNRGYVFRDGRIKPHYAVALHASREYQGRTYLEIAAAVMMTEKQYETALLRGREAVAELLELRDAFQRAEEAARESAPA